MTPIYLDYNATTPIAPEVLEAMLPYLRQHFGNPSSAHPYGRAAHEGVERARAQVAELLGCAPEEIVFTGGGTEANNLALRGFWAARGQAGGHVVTSAVEHPAIEQPCRVLEAAGAKVTRSSVHPDGRMELGLCEKALEERGTVLVSVMHSNNETGALQPIAEIARLARARGIAVHTDAAQSVGKVPVRVDELGVDLLSVAGHKLYAPKGVGALYVRRGTPLAPLIRGAGHERGVRPGTENVASIVGLGAACELARRDPPALAMRALADRLLAALEAGIPGLRLNGPPVERLPNTVNVSAPGALGRKWLEAAPEIAASTGSACHSGVDEPSAVLTAMGIEARWALGSVRLSVGRYTTPEEVDVAAAALIRAWHACK